MSGNDATPIRGLDLSGETPPLGAWATVGHPAVVEQLARVGFDFLLLEAEHAPSGLETVESMVRAAEAAAPETPALVRVAENDAALLKRTLDTGADGVMVPLVESAEEARAAVAATRYPPEGVRGLGSHRGTEYGARKSAYAAGAAELTVLVQVERERAVERADTIAAVEGVDGLFVGPTDLSLSLGVERDDEDFEAAVREVIDAAHEAGVPVGTVTTDPEAMGRWIERGVDFLVPSVDFPHLQSGARDARERAREKFS
jgi:2-dehydro-3-deoxyglucarate aldolase/4-hydroxy-2-oxoheptanedioate aldolase